MNTSNQVLVVPRFAAVATALLLVAALFGTATMVEASSHREAPMITDDPKVDATDLYAFVSPNDEDHVVFIANYLPFQEPSGGPNFFSFDDNARYNINIDNDGDAVADVVYRFEFDSSYINDETFLYATGPISSLNDSDLNYRQIYEVTRVENGKTETIAKNVMVPPVNIGDKTITVDYADLQAEAVADLDGEGMVFAGQSDDSFFVDLAATFDLLNVRELPGDNGGGVDNLAGYNVLSLVLEVPKSEVMDDDSVIGVWTTAERRSTMVLDGDGDADYEGDWVQVSRLGQPLVNEVVIPVGEKDRFNASMPNEDTQFANLVANPEFPVILNALFGIEVPPQGDFGTDEQRTDLITIFLTGIEGLNQPAGIVPSEQLRLNLDVAVSEDPNPLGVVGGDNQGFPNGRRLGDDVVDAALKVMAGAAYPLLADPDFEPDATGVRLGDGVDENDVPYRSEFPYVGLPHNGTDAGMTAMSSDSEGKVDATPLIQAVQALLKMMSM